MNGLTSTPVPPLGPDDHVRGDPRAALVIVYADFTCPRCALAAERLRAAPVRTCFRHLALASRHRRAVPLAVAAEAAARQGAFWALHDALFADQGRLDDPHLWERCRRLGLDLERLETDRRDPALAERVARDVRGALRAGAATTPAYAVDAVLHQGVPAVEWLAALG